MPSTYIDADAKSSDIIEFHVRGYGKVIFVLKGNLPRAPGVEPLLPPPVVKENVVQGFSTL